MRLRRYVCAPRFSSWRSPRPRAVRLLHIGGVEAVFVGAVLPPVADHDQRFVIRHLRRRVGCDWSQYDDCQDRRIEIERPNARDGGCPRSAIVNRQELYVMRLGVVK